MLLEHLEDLVRKVFDLMLADPQGELPGRENRPGRGPSIRVSHILRMFVPGGWTRRFVDIIERLFIGVGKKNICIIIDWIKGSESWLCNSSDKANQECA